MVYSFRNHPVRYVILNNVHTYYFTYKKYHHGLTHLCTLPHEVFVLRLFSDCLLKISQNAYHQQHFTTFTCSFPVKEGWREKGRKGQKMREASAALSGLSR